MLWLLYSFLTAFSHSLKDVFSKKGLKELDPYTVSFGQRFLSFLILLPLLLIVGIPEIKSDFYLGLIVSGTINVFTTILYMKALKASDLSITVPMIAFTPLFLLITSPLILGEYPSTYGMIGVILIVFGSYLLNIKKRKIGLLYPFKALVKEKGPRYMLFVALLWSISANFDKIALVNSSPLFYSVAVNLYTSLFLFGFLMRQKKVNEFSNNLKNIFPIAFFTSLIFIFQMSALELAIVPYVISIKRTSTIMAVFWGAFLFKEKGIRERLLGASVMLIGVLFIGLG